VFNMVLKEDETAIRSKMEKGDSAKPKLELKKKNGYPKAGEKESRPEMFLPRTSRKPRSRGPSRTNQRGGTKWVGTVHCGKTQE